MPALLWDDDAMSEWHEQLVEELERHRKQATSARSRHLLFRRAGLDQPVPADSFTDALRRPQSIGADEFCGIFCFPDVPVLWDELLPVIREAEQAQTLPPGQVVLALSHIALAPSATQEALDLVVASVGWFEDPSVSRITAWPAVCRPDFDLARLPAAIESAWGEYWYEVPNLNAGVVDLLSERLALTEFQRHTLSRMRLPVPEAVDVVRRLGD